MTIVMTIVRTVVACKKGFGPRFAGQLVHFLALNYSEIHVSAEQCQSIDHENMIYRVQLDGVNTQLILRR